MVPRARRRGAREGLTSDGEAARGLPFSWWVPLGGRSVQSVFEATVEALTGHRPSTMIDNWPYYAALAYVQTAALGAVCAARLRAGRSSLAPVCLVSGLAVLANACLGARWPWWGT